MFAAWSRVNSTNTVPRTLLRASPGRTGLSLSHRATFFLPRNDKIDWLACYDNPITGFIGSAKELTCPKTERFAGQRRDCRRRPEERPSFFDPVVVVAQDVNIPTTLPVVHASNPPAAILGRIGGASSTGIAANASHRLPRKCNCIFIEPGDGTLYLCRLRETNAFGNRAGSRTKGASTSQLQCTRTLIPRDPHPLEEMLL